MGSEYDWMRAAGEALAPYGEVDLTYTTAELEPYSAQQRPDVVLAKRRADGGTSTYFVTLKRCNGKTLSAADIPLIVDQVREARSAFGSEICFLYAVDCAVDDATRQQVLNSGVHELFVVGDGHELGKAVHAWISKTQARAD